MVAKKKRVAPAAATAATEAPNTTESMAIDNSPQQQQQEEEEKVEEPQPIEFASSAADAAAANGQELSKDDPNSATTEDNNNNKEEDEQLDEAAAASANGGEMIVAEEEDEQQQQQQLKASDDTQPMPQSADVEKDIVDGADVTNPSKQDKKEEGDSTVVKESEQNDWADSTVNSTSSQSASKGSSNAGTNKQSYDNDGLLIVNRMNSMRLTCGPLNAQECLDSRLEEVYDLAACTSLHMPRILESVETEKPNCKYGILDLEFLSEENTDKAKLKLEEIYAGNDRVKIEKWPESKIYFNDYEYLKSDPKVLQRFKHSMLVAGFHKLKETWACVKFLDPEVTDAQLLEHFPSAIYSFRPEPSQFYVRMDTRDTVQKLIGNMIKIDSRTYKIRPLSMQQTGSNQYGRQFQQYGSDGGRQNNYYNSNNQGNYNNRQPYYQNRNSGSNSYNSGGYGRSPYGMPQQANGQMFGGQYQQGQMPMHNQSSGGMMYQNYGQQQMPHHQQNQGNFTGGYYNQGGANNHPQNSYQNVYQKRGGYYGQNYGNMPNNNVNAKRPNY